MVSATSSGTCVVDVNVEADSQYSASSTTATVVFTTIDAGTSASATPSPTAWTNTSQVNVTTLSTGAVTYSIDGSSTASGCAVDLNGVVSATSSGTCVVDVNVEADSQYSASSTTATVVFTTIDAGTSASATPSPTAWTNTSQVNVTTLSTGAVTYSIDGSSTASGCAVDLNGVVSATSSGTCVVDVNVEADSQYSASSTTATVVFTTIDAGTSASATPSPTAWTNTSQVNVTTLSTGAVTYSIDGSSTASGCAVDLNGVVSATSSGTCVVDVNVEADSQYSASSTTATVVFTTIDAGTSASATPSPTAWTNTSQVNVTTLSTGAVTYSIDGSSTPAAARST